MIKSDNDLSLMLIRAGGVLSLSVLMSKKECVCVCSTELKLYWDHVTEILQKQGSHVLNPTTTTHDPQHTYAMCSKYGIYLIIHTLSYTYCSFQTISHSS